jgi:hypothetical protein
MAAAGGPTSFFSDEDEPGIEIHPRYRPAASTLPINTIAIPDKIRTFIFLPLKLSLSSGGAGSLFRDAPFAGRGSKSMGFVLVFSIIFPLNDAQFQEG